MSSFATHLEVVARSPDSEVGQVDYMPIRIRCHDNKRDETQLTEAQSVIAVLSGESMACFRDRNQSSASYADQSNHCWTDKVVKSD
jgi:hypothetical protein